MMIKKLIFIVAIIFCAQLTFAQNDDDFEMIRMYKNLIEKSDSLKAHGKISTFEIKNIEAIARNLDKKEPSKYFEMSYQYFRDSKYNESAFLYYLGKMREGDYNKNGQGHYSLGGDLDMILEEGIFMYLATDADNYLKILNKAINFYDKNPYSYISHTKNYNKLKASSKYSELIIGLENDTLNIDQELQKGRQEMVDRITPYFILLEQKTATSK